MNIEITDFYFLLDIIFYYLILLLIISVVKYLKRKPDLIKSKEIILPLVAVFGIILILIYALVFDRARVSVIEPLNQIATPSPTPEPKHLTVNLDQVNKSGVSGKVDFTDNNGNLSVDLRLDPNKPDEQNIIIYSGTCKKIGQIKYQSPIMISIPIIKLPNRETPLNLGQRGVWQNLILDQITEELPLAIVIHQGEKGDIVSCGEIISREPVIKTEESTPSGKF